MHGGGRTVLVTGANSGIGLATALRCAHEGFRTVATVRSPAKAAVVQAAAEAGGYAIETAILEVTDADACAAVIERYRPFALVNNAGINTIAAFEDADDALAREQFEINAIAPMRLARLAIPHMRTHGGGRIINVTSTSGLVHLPLLCTYQAAKHAAEAATAALRVELASAGIGVATVIPGGVDTEIYDKGFWVEPDLYPDTRYATAYGRLKRLMGIGKRSTSSDRVAAVVVQAIAARHPRSRYLVGLDAHLLVANHRLVPPVIRDRVQRLVFGL